MQKIFPAFYIGNFDVAKDRDNLWDKNITHIVFSYSFIFPHLIYFLVSKSVKPFLKDEFEYLVIPAEDSESEILTPYFKKSFDFIETGKREGAVLVCCETGKSLSAAICIAYIAKKLKTNLKDSYGLLKDIKKDVRPNNSFVKQLKDYFEQLANAPEEVPEPRPPSPKQSKEEEDEDDDIQIYDDEVEENEPKSSKEPPKAIIEAPKEVPVVIEAPKEVPVVIEAPKIIEATSNTISQPESKKEEEIQVSKEEKQEESIPTLVPIQKEPPKEEPLKEPVKKNVYLCKKCRLTLFSQEDIIPHEPGEGQESFNYHKRTNAISECTSFFVRDSMEWMGDLGALDGKLACSKCGTKVGSWRWDGGQCSCGAWLTPCFQVLKSRVDVVVRKQ